MVPGILPCLLLLLLCMARDIADSPFANEPAVPNRGDIVSPVVHAGALAIGDSATSAQEWSQAGASGVSQGNKCGPFSSTVQGKGFMHCSPQS